MVSRRFRLAVVVVLFSSLFAVAGLGKAAQRSEAHDKYADVLWQRITDSKSGYTTWQKLDSAPELSAAGPAPGPHDVLYANRLAAEAKGELPRGSAIVKEHRDQDGEVVGVTACVKQRSGYDSRNSDWYWIHYVGDGVVAKSSVDKPMFDKPGFVTIVDDGRLWVFEEASGPLRDFLTTGEPAKHVTMPGVGPKGLTLKSADGDIVLKFLAARPGFVIRLADDRLWVFRAGSEALQAFDETGDLAKRIILPGAGPRGITLCGVEREDLDDYIYSKPGFVTKVVDGRLWVFRTESPDLQEFRKSGEPAKHVTQPGAGPAGITIKAPDTETIQEYLAAQEGFHTKIQDGRIWVFGIDSAEWEDFKKGRELAKHVVRPGAGPLGMTLRAPDAETLDASVRTLAN